MTGLEIRNFNMQQYKLKQSSTLNLFSIALYCAVIVAASTLLPGMILISGSLIVLAALLLIRDQYRFRLLKSQDPVSVILRDSTTRVEINHLGDHLQFDRFRLFSNRWFLILQMKNEKVTKNIILLSDRFDTINEYLRFRYRITKMSRNQHVA